MFLWGSLAWSQQEEAQGPQKPGVLHNEVFPAIISNRKKSPGALAFKKGDPEQCYKTVLYLPLVMPGSREVGDMVQVPSGSLPSLPYG